MFFVNDRPVAGRGRGRIGHRHHTAGALLGGLVSGVAGHKLPCLTASSAGVDGWYDNRGRRGGPDRRGDRGGTGTVLRCRGLM
jgi:hypothetical protein